MHWRHNHWAGLYASCIRGPTDNLQRAVVFHNKACSSAKIADVYGELDAIGDDTDLVLLSIGGNDLDFLSVVGYCFYVKHIDCCRDKIETAESKLLQLQGNITTLLGAIRNKARSDTKVVLVSYPYMSVDVG